MLNEFKEPLSKAPWWLPGGHLQTVYASLFQPSLRQVPKGKRTVWVTPDDDEIVVDEWAPAQARSHATPCLVLFHGLEGGSDSHYAKAFAQTALHAGWRMVLPHFRGCAGRPNLKPRAYHSGDHAEIDWILRRIKSTIRHPDEAPLHAVGISLGGNALLRWAQERGAEANRLASSVVSVCAPLDLVRCGLALERGLNRWLYTPRFLRTMKPKARAMARLHPGHFDLAAALRAKTLREFDDAFTAPLHGFHGVMDYWQKASSKPHLRQLQISSLLINPLNDPFVPRDALPHADEVNPCTTLWQPKQGGHVGWVEGQFPGHLFTWPERILQWMQAVQAQHG